MSRSTHCRDTLLVATYAYPKSLSHVTPVTSLPTVGRHSTRATWMMEIVPTASGSRLTITERREVYNRSSEALAKDVFSHTSTMESLLKAVTNTLA